MILEFDLGNTRCKWRLRDGQVQLVRGYLLTAESFGDLDILLGLYRAQIKQVRCVSVVSEGKEGDLKDWCKSFLNIVPEFVHVLPVCAGVVNGYIEPSKLGADRWVGIVCAYNRLRKALILISFGTAITVDLVLGDGRHVGGFIAPGINLMLDSLSSGTCRIVIEKSFSSSSLQAGITTYDAVHSALAAMLVGLIDNGVAQLHQLEPEVRPDIVFTGGDAGKFLQFYPEAKQMPDLVLDGLDYIFNDPKNVER